MCPLFPTSVDRRYRTASLRPRLRATEDRFTIRGEMGRGPHSRARGARTGINKRRVTAWAS